MADEQSLPTLTQNAAATSNNNISAQAEWAVELLAQNGTATVSNGRGQAHDHDLPGITKLSGLSNLPALLGLDTLSLSLPTSGSTGAKTTTAARTTAKTTATPAASISRIRVHGIPADRIHLLFSSPALDTGIRSGFWIYVPSTIPNISLRFKWDRDAEELEPCFEDQLTEDKTSGTSIKIFDYRELLRIRSGASPERDGWASLTRFITPAELNRLIPTNDTHTNGIQTWPVSTLSTSPVDIDLETSSVQKADINFTPITLKNTFPPSSIGRDRTKHSLDKSWYLSSILPPESSPSANTIYGSTLLAEFALSFLLASTLGSSSASQHWKDILRVSLRCTSAVTSSETFTFFVALLQLLEAQLRDLNVFPSSRTPGDDEQHASEQGRSTAPSGNQNTSALFESEDDLAALYELLFTFGQKNLADNPTTTTLDQESTSPVTLSNPSISETKHPQPPRAAVRAAYLSLATSTTSTSTAARATIAPSSSSSSWDLAAALSSTSANDEDDQQHKRLQRQILRGVEGFGYASGLGLGSAGMESGLADGFIADHADTDDEDDDDAPVVLDLEGLLHSPREDGEDGELGDVEHGSLHDGPVVKDRNKNAEENADEDEDEDEDEEDDEELEDLRY